MPLSRPRPRRVLNLTPLIDVVFLLLVFFMLASTFLKFGTVKLETAGAGSATGDLSKVALIHIEAEGRFRIAGLPVEARAFGEALDRLLKSGKTDAVLVLRKNAKAADLIKGLTRVRQTGFASVRVVE
ncbi:MAG: biopolymer transporter ExbD [Hyphomicrobiaceae bacterium]